MLEECVDLEFKRLLTFFITHKGRLAKMYNVDKIFIAPWDTFSEIKSEEEKYIVYGTVKDKIVLIKGEVYEA